jgi:hypothetical protein
VEHNHQKLELKPAVRTDLLSRPAVADLPRYAAFADLINSHKPDVVRRARYWY